MYRKSKATPLQVCSLFLGESCPKVDNPDHEWEIGVPEKKFSYKSVINTDNNEIKTIKILQISDMHWDPYYQEGSLADCPETLCCREKVKDLVINRISNDKLAGKYGDYRKCDTPEVTLDSMIQHIQDNHNVETGFLIFLVPFIYS